MNREPMSTATPELMPPARTRDVPLGPAPVRGLNLLAPVLSGLFGRATALPGAPVAEPEEHAIGESMVVTGIEGGTWTVDDETGDVEIVADEVTIEIEEIADFEADDDADEALTIDVDSPDLDLDEAEEATIETAFGALAVDIDEPEPETAVQWYGDDQSAPWEREDDSDDAGEEATEIWLAEDDAADDELVLDAADATDAAVDDTVAASAEAEAEMRQAPPPLSPWDLGAAAISGEAGERAARARAEWESLGQALSESLTGASPLPEEPGPHGYDLTDERAAELDAEDDSPFGVLSVGASGHIESPVTELVRRLEAFAASLRDEGPGALARAQTGDDRFDALLASIAAGFLAGRGE